MHNPNWQTFLETQGARIKEGVIQDFGSPDLERNATRDSTVLCELSQFGILRVSGEDAQTFLHSLCSSDIKALTPNLAQLSSLNSAKGRVLATFLVWREGADYFLHIPHALLAPIQKKFSLYILRSKVKIDDVSSQHICFGIAGKNAESALQSCIGTPPTTALAVEQYATASVIRLGPERFQINVQLGEDDKCAALWQQLASHATPAGSPCWDWLNIRAGIPVILPATQEQHVLQMLNLDILRGVSFKKGCYPGQEIVARMQYLGKLKQRTFLAHVNSEIAPQSNDALFSDDFAGQSSGSILNAAPAPQGGYDVLATLQISTVTDSRVVHWKTPDGAELEFLPLPYSTVIEA